jgi:hypothetical protein
MAADSLTVQVREFLTRYIASIEQLEILCILSEQHHKSWSVTAIFQQIQSSEKSILNCLAKFRDAGLVVLAEEGTYRFSPKDTGSFETVQAVAKAYRERRISVTEFIYKKPSDPIQDFARAFRLRKEK